MPSRKKSSTAAEIARIEGLIEELEGRLRRLTDDAHDEATGASSDVEQFVSDTVERLIGGARDRANVLTDRAADRASKASIGAYKRIAGEAENHPLATLAVAASIGFLVGASRR